MRNKKRVFTQYNFDEKKAYHQWVFVTADGSLVSLMLEHPVPVPFPMVRVLAAKIESDNLGFEEYKPDGTV